MKPVGIWKDKETGIKYAALASAKDDNEAWQGEISESCFITVPLKLHGLLSDNRDCSGMWTPQQFAKRFERA